MGLLRDIRCLRLKGDKYAGWVRTDQTSVGRVIEQSHVHLTCTFPVNKISPADRYYTIFSRGTYALSRENASNLNSSHGKGIDFQSGGGRAEDAEVGGERIFFRGRT